MLKHLKKLQHHQYIPINMTKQLKILLNVEQYCEYESIKR